MFRAKRLQNILSILRVTVNYVPWLEHYVRGLVKAKLKCHTLSNWQLIRDYKKARYLKRASINFNCADSYFVTGLRLAKLLGDHHQNTPLPPTCGRDLMLVAHNKGPSRF